MILTDVDGFFRVYVDQGRYNISILSGGMSHDAIILLRTLLNYRLRAASAVSLSIINRVSADRAGLPRRLVWPLLAKTGAEAAQAAAEDAHDTAMTQATATRRLVWPPAAKTGAEAARAALNWQGCVFAPARSTPPEPMGRRAVADGEVFLVVGSGDVAA